MSHSPPALTDRPRLRTLPIGYSGRINAPRRDAAHFRCDDPVAFSERAVQEPD